MMVSQELVKSSFEGIVICDLIIIVLVGQPIYSVDIHPDDVHFVTGGQGKGH